MRKFTHSSFSAHLKSRLEKCNAKFIPIAANVRSQPGIPDRFLLHVYWSGWVEVKIGDDPMRENQKLFEEECQRVKCPHCVIRLKDEKVSILCGTKIKFIKLDMLNKSNSLLILSIKSVWDVYVTSLENSSQTEDSLNLSPDIGG